MFDLREIFERLLCVCVCVCVCACRQRLEAREKMIWVWDEGDAVPKKEEKSWRAASNDINL
jgi:hypothetical protein